MISHEKMKNWPVTLRLPSPSDRDDEVHRPLLASAEGEAPQDQPIHPESMLWGSPSPLWLMARFRLREMSKLR